MIKRISIIVIFLIINVSSFAQDIKHTRQSLNFNGNVKSCYGYAHLGKKETKKEDVDEIKAEIVLLPHGLQYVEFDKNGLLQTKLGYFHDTSNADNYYFYFYNKLNILTYKKSQYNNDYTSNDSIFHNENGLIKTRIQNSYHSESPRNEESYKSKLEYNFIYAKKNILKREEVFHYPFIHDDFKVIYTYNDLGQVILFEKYNKSKKLEKKYKYIYNKQQLIDSSYCIVDTGESIWRGEVLRNLKTGQNTKYFYDISNNLILTKIYDYKDHSLLREIQYKYNKNNLCIEMKILITSDDNKLEVLKINYEYNKNNNLIKRTNYQKGKIETTTYWTFDENKNWIKKKGYSKGRLQYIIERNIVYYN